MIEAQVAEEIGIVHDTHPVETTSWKVAAYVEANRYHPLGAAILEAFPPIQANVEAASANPPVRFKDKELTSAFGSFDTSTYEGQLWQELWEKYRRLKAVIDIHNNASILRKYVTVGPNSLPVTMQLAGRLDAKDVLIYPSDGKYHYFDMNPNLLVVEGREDDPDYSARWWYRKLADMAVHGVGSAARSDQFRYFQHIPTILTEEAQEAGVLDFVWQASFDTPLPREIAEKVIDIPRLEIPNDATVYATNWPQPGKTHHGPPVFFANVAIASEAPEGWLRGENQQWLDQQIDS